MDPRSKHDISILLILALGDVEVEIQTFHGKCVDNGLAICGNIECRMLVLKSLMRNRETK